MKLFVLMIACVMNLNLIAWQNWSANQHCNPEFFYPVSKDEIINLVRSASATNHTIRVIGAGHSFSDIACSKDWAISLRHCNRVLQIDREKLQIRVEGGITLNEFTKIAGQNGMALPNLPAIDNITLAGAVCTATHGTGHTGTLSSFITEMELVTADGITHQLSFANDPLAFQAACVSLGSLGVIYSLTMQCVPLYRLEHFKKEMSLQEFLLCYKTLHEETDHVQFLWDVNTDIIYSEFLNRRTFNKPIPAPVTAEEMGFGPLGFDVNGDLILSSEIALPIDSLPQAITILKEVLTKWADKGVTVLAVVGRFVAADKYALISPTSHGDTVFLNIATSVGASYEGLYRDIEARLYEIKGRPHWAKINFLNYEKVLSLYGENFLKFLEVKKRLDPKNVFSNDFTQRVLAWQPLS